MNPMNNAPKAFDFMGEPIRQDMTMMREEMRKMKSEYDLANERFSNLK